MFFISWCVVHWHQSLLLPSLVAASGRVITVSSGGMYSASLPADGQLEMPADAHNGVTQCVPLLPTLPSSVLCHSLRMQADVGIYVCVGIAGCHLSSWWFLGVLGRYAIAKRAQVTLNEMWAVREPRVGFYAMHPGACVHPGTGRVCTLVQGWGACMCRGAGACAQHTALQGAAAIAR